MKKIVCSFVMAGILFAAALAGAAENQEAAGSDLDPGQGKWERTRGRHENMRFPNQGEPMTFSNVHVEVEPTREAIDALSEPTVLEFGTDWWRSLPGCSTADCAGV